MIGTKKATRRARRVRGLRGLGGASKHGTSYKKKERAQENLPEDEQKDETGHGDSPVGSGRNVRNPWAYKALFGETKLCCGKWTLQLGDNCHE